MGESVSVMLFEHLSDKQMDVLKATIAKLSQERFPPFFSRV